MTSPPPPPISKILTLTLPRSLTFALSYTPSLTSSALPSLTPVTSKLTALTPAPTLPEAWNLLHTHSVQIIVVTNGAKKTTLGYIDSAGLSGLVGPENVLSCDDVGLAKPHREVYEGAMKRCAALGGEEGARWFVAAHAWDVCAARKNG